VRTNVAVPRSPVRNHEGTPVPRINAEKELWRTVTASLLWEDSFYESGESVADRIKTLTLSVKPEFAAALAREARSAMKLRHVPLWVARWLASGTLAQKAVVEDLLAEIIQRPDELTEFLSLYWKDGKTPIAASVKRGLARAFQKFNAYSLAKYNRPDAIKLRDVLFLVHAKPKDEEQAATWKQLVDGTLPTPDTWEVALSGGGDKKETWTRLLNEKKLGALALLRNLRNMIEAKVDDGLIVTALDACDTERVLPFRFISAAKYAPRFEPALERAMYRSLAGQEKLKGRTALVVDTSPSMWMAKVSAKSEMDRFEAAAALAILCREVCEDVTVYAFNNKAYEVPARRGFALRDALSQTKGDASCGGLAVQMANERGYDRIVVLTDGQWHVMGQGRVLREEDAKVLSPAPLTERAYMVNVANYQNGVGYGKWTAIDGWSEAIVTYIQAFEQQGEL
jgi:60 kDa SS-A/Ro ribonucleoprotein